MPKPLDLLAIGAHPDDAEMTSGGWLAVAAQQGYRTGILHLSRGEMGTRGTPKTRAREARAAARALGCAVLEFAGLRDGFIHPDDESVRAVADWIRVLKPACVVAPYMRCHHPDHEEAAALCIRAVHFAGLMGYRTKYQRHRVRNLVHARYSHHFEPGFYVDVSAGMACKKAAIECYRSQFEPASEVSGEPQTRMSRPGFVDQFLALNAMLGLKAGCAHAEAYWMRVGPLLADPLKTLAESPPHHLVR